MRAERRKRALTSVPRLAGRGADAGAGVRAGAILTMSLSGCAERCFSEMIRAHVFQIVRDVRLGSGYRLRPADVFMERTQ